MLLVRLLVQLALLQPPGGPPEHDGPPRPPKEAIEACASKADGDACSFAGREGETVTGSCFSPASDKPLACRPDHPPPR